MARHLAAAGHDVTVFNRTSAKAEKWTEAYSGGMRSTPAEAAEGTEIIFACVGNDQDSLAVGKAAIEAMASGSIYVDHTTTSSACAEELAAFAETRTIGFIDAPVSGGEAGAINGALSIMCGADEAILAKAQPVMEAYAKRIVHVGPIGHGQLCKAVNQICIAGVLQGLSEAVNFAERAGLDMEKTLEAVSGGAAQSWQMENRWATMAKGEFEFGFAVDWMRKDLDIAMKDAERIGADLTMTKLVDGYYEEVQAKGGNRWDTSSLVTRLK
jgi:3-hydroxyisobutyrate dehydrogenase-like beta-hydroxyacid dehydrogenase